MKIREFNISSNQSKSSGLEEVNLRFNSNTVAIVGKNGSGKTRFLKLIKSDLANYKQSHNKNGITDIPQFVQSKLKNTGSNKYISNLITYISPDDIKKLSTSITNQQTQRTNQRVFSYEDILNLQVENVDTDEYKSMTSSALSYFQNLATRIVIEQTNYMTKPLSSFKKTKLYQNYKSLYDKFNSLIEKELDFKIEDKNLSIAQDGTAKIKGIWMLDGRQFNFDQLSDGEKTLFSYILLLFLQENYHYSKTKNSIILIDEPEIHLHPEAQIKLIQGLSELIGENGQLIIATHSLTILSLFNYDQIYLIRSNKIFPPNSSRPEEALNDLIGNQNRIKYLMNMFSNISSWALSHFMLNNFEQPEVIESSKKNDPQFEMFTDTLGKPDIDFLDFGCGRGRLLKLIDDSDDLTSTFNSIDAFEPNSSFHDELTSINLVDEVYSKLEDLTSDSYDVILISNVLHEIDLKDIVKTLTKLLISLKKNGSLIIIEDLILRKGEMPNSKGYFVFNENELKALFDSPNELPTIEPRLDRHKNRLMAAIVNKENVGKVSSASLSKALLLLKERSFEQAKKLRNENGYNEGRTYGFYVQQYINCEIELKK